MNIQEWRKANPLSPHLYWRDIAITADDRLHKLAEFFSADAVVVGTHASKSCPLPVVEITVGTTKFTLRDNLFDTNLAVEAIQPVTLPLHVLGPVHDWEWYLQQIDRCRHYTFRGWSDEEMADPRILRVLVVHPGHQNQYWSEVDAETKDRWIARFTSTAWHGLDWGPSLLVEGEMGPAAKFVELHTGFQEGFPKKYFGYSPGSTQFVLMTNTANVREKMLAVLLTQSSAVDGDADGQKED